MPSHAKLSIVESNLTDDGVILRFSNGTIVLFHAQFLYDVRDQNANVNITAYNDEE